MRETPAIEDFVSSLASAWQEGEARPTHRKEPTAKHWWRTRVNPFAEAWPVVEGWLIADPAVSAKRLMQRLATLIPKAYARCRLKYEAAAQKASALATAAAIGRLNRPGFGGGSNS